MATPRLPSAWEGDWGGGNSPPRFPDGVAQEEGGDGVPPLRVPGGFPVEPDVPRSGDWYLQPEDDQGHDGFPEDVVEAGDDDDEEGILEAGGVEEDKGVLEVSGEQEQGEKGHAEVPDQTDERGEDDFDEQEMEYESAYYWRRLLELEDSDSEMAVLTDGSSDDVYHGEVPRAVEIRGLVDIKHIRFYPQTYARVSRLVIASLCFGDIGDMVYQTQKTQTEQGWQEIINMECLLQAQHLSTTLGEISNHLKHLTQDFEEQYVDRRLINAISHYLSHLGADNTALQPPNICYYAEAVSNALRVLIAALPGNASAASINYDELRACARYILGRIEAIHREDIQYPDRNDVLAGPQEEPIAPVNNNGQAYEAEVVVQVAEEEYVPLYNLTQLMLPDAKRDPDSLYKSPDSYDDDTLDPFVSIRGLTHLERIMRSPESYCRSSYYIVSSFLFGDTWQMLDNIRKTSEKQCWVWVGNMDKLRQGHNIRDTVGFLSRDLKSISRLLKDHQFNREMVTSLARFIVQMDLSSTSMQPPNIRYCVDAIAVELQALIGMLPAELLDAEIHNSLIDFASTEAHVQIILQRMQALDNEHVVYPEDVEPPEVLPVLPGPAPLPLPSPNNSPRS